ncbi:glycosyltransferase family 2 protein [Hymenobacter sp. UV11]|uniref:glycosyltransferase family 2 protein n=1 Tax=Hymenobacter sp. UV11 TaxID=1849735 RepID=UPI001060FE5D|nr:glycosyltransferase family 2 protein [Hymenobacter sp. UV11]TDN39589.1 glycosyl transferase family 2 [Hymenobacter sp. UV11]TFZ63335.1 glycosyltransferase family 2 protein [Hymenobacter sp. UV11]
MISVIILTKNEAADLPNCLDSVKWSNDVHILDSGSTDKTLEIARHYGAKVTSNPFESFGKQRNFALEHLTIQHDWILFLDADEVVTSEFKRSVFKAVSEAPEIVAGFYCCWKMILEGKWLKHCDNFPKWQFRLLRKNRAKFTDFGHGQKEKDVDGLIMYIKEPYLHYGFSKGWAHWLDRHNRYSSQEAAARIHDCPPIKQIFASHTSIRNPALKSWLSRLPGWPLLRFIQAYFLNLGFLEGIQGLIYCINISYYEFLIQIKMRNIKAEEITPFDHTSNNV